MKSLLTSLLVLAILTEVGSAPEAIRLPKKWKVTFSVTYNSMTLQEAADKEKLFRELFKDACDVDVDLWGDVKVYYENIGRSQNEKTGYRSRYHGEFGHCRAC